MVIPDNKTRIAIILTKDLKDKIQEKAKEENRSMSNYIVTILQKHIEEG